MKKLVCVTLVIIMLISTVACSGSTTQTTTDQAATTTAQATSESAQTTTANTQAAAVTTQSTATDPVTEASGTTSDLQGKIVIGGWPVGDEAFKEIIPEFNKQFPNVEVELNFMASADFIQQLQTSVAAGSGAPDVAMVRQLHIGLYKDADGFENLFNEPYNAGQYKDVFSPAKWDLTVSTNGKKLVGIAWDMGPVTMFYRRDIFESVGLPSDPEGVTELMSTWDGFLDAAEKIYIPNERWIVYNAAALYLWNYLNYDFYDKDLNLMIDTPASRAALEAAIKIRQNGWDAEISGQFANETNGLIGSGGIATMVSGCWYGGSLKNTYAPDSSGLWGITRIPAGIPDSNSGGSFLLMPSQGQNKEAAWEFIKFALINPDSQNAMFRKVDYFPSLMTAWDDPSYDEPDPYFGGQKTRALWADIAGNIKSPTLVTMLNDPTNTIMSSAVNSLLSENKTVDEILLELENQIILGTKQEKEQYMKILADS